MTAGDVAVVADPPGGGLLRGDARASAGASLQREFERRSSARTERIRSVHPRLSGLILAVTDDPQTTKAFQSGAKGERRAAERVIGRAGPEVLFLLNRSLGLGCRNGDIDMLAIGPAGVYVVDVKRYGGASVQVRRTPRLFTPAREQLYIGGRDRTALLDSVRRQVDAVRAALAALPGKEDLRVSPALCFIDTKLPLFGTLRVGGMPLLGPKATAQLVGAAGDLNVDARTAVWRHLAHMLPAAA